MAQQKGRRERWLVTKDRHVWSLSSATRDTGLLALSPGPGLAGRGEPESADTAVKDGVGPGRKSNLPDPLELIFSPLY